MKLYDRLISKIPGNMPRAPKGHSWSVETVLKEGYRKEQRYSVLLLDSNGDTVRSEPLQQGYGYSVTEESDVTWPRIVVAVEKVLDKIEDEAIEKKFQEARQKKGSSFVRTYGTSQKGATKWRS